MADGPFHNWPPRSPARPNSLLRTLIHGPQSSPQPSSALSRLLESIRPTPGQTLLTGLGLPRKRSVFVSYHHRGDQAFKEALVRVYCDQYELLEDNSLERVLDTDDLKYVEREIREDYIRGASAAIMLCGAETFNRKFVDWEIYATLLKRAALVGVRLPDCRALPWRLFDNALTGYAVMGDWDDLVGSSLPLRAWIELALARDAGLIDNSRPKMRANGERRVHPLYG